MQHKLTIKNKLNQFMDALFPFRKSTHVRMSDRFRNILQNPELSNKLVDAIIQHKKEIDDGKSVQVDGSELVVTSVTSLPITPSVETNK